MQMLLIAAAVCLHALRARRREPCAAAGTQPPRAFARQRRTDARKAVQGPERVHFRERVLEPLVTSLARAMLRLNPKQALESLARLLMSAGVRNLSPQAFLAIKGTAGVTGFALGFAIGGSSSPKAGLILGSMAGAIGYIAPSMIVSSRARKRQAALSADLPDALDLLAVSVEAGLAFDGAVAKLTQYMKGPLVDEFELALGGMRVGESRADALKKLAERAGAPEVASFVRSIIQADQLGTSLGRILRVQAVDSRLKRQAAAEERAMKAPVKMLFPTVAFIFPAMFIVVLGPAMLTSGSCSGSEMAALEEQAEETTEHGFGTGLRAQLEARASAADTAARKAPRSPREAVAAAEPAPPPPAAAAADNAGADALRNELDASLAREQELRFSLKEQLDTSARELELEQEAARRAAELDRRAEELDLKEREFVAQDQRLDERLAEFEDGHVELERLREEVEATAARISDREQTVALKVRELKLADEQRSAATADLAQQVAAIAERERALGNVERTLEARARDLDTKSEELDLRAVERERTADAAERELDERRHALADAETRAHGRAVGAHSSRRRDRSSGDGAGAAAGGAARRSAGDGGGRRGRAARGRPRPPRGGARGPRGGAPPPRGRAAPPRGRDHRRAGAPGRRARPAPPAGTRAHARRSRGAARGRSRSSPRARVRA